MLQDVSKLERSGQNGSAADCLRMQQALNFLPDPQGQGSLRPTFFPTLRTGSRFFSVDRWLAAMAASCWLRTPPGGCARRRAATRPAGGSSGPGRAASASRGTSRNSGSNCSTRKIRSVTGRRRRSTSRRRSSSPRACTRPWGRSGRSLAGRSSCGGGPSPGGVPSSSSRGSGAGRTFSISRISGRCLASRALSSVLRTSPAVIDCELVGGDLDARASCRAQAASSASAVGIGRRGRSCRRRAGGPMAAASLASSSSASRGALVVLVGQRRCSSASISGRSIGRSSSASIDGVEPLATPRRPGPRGRSGASGVCDALARGTGVSAIRDRQLGFLLGVELAGLRPGSGGRSRPGRGPAQLAGSIARPNL